SCPALRSRSRCLGTAALSSLSSATSGAPTSSCLSFFFLLLPPPPRSTLFPYTTLFRSVHVEDLNTVQGRTRFVVVVGRPGGAQRSEEHTSELQSLAYLVCRLLLEKKKKIHTT